MAAKEALSTRLGTTSERRTSGWGLCLGVLGVSRNCLFPPCPYISVVSSLGEIQEAIEKLSPEQRQELRQWLETFEADGVEESDELMAAVDEGIRALEAQGGIPLEQARKRFLDRWHSR